MARKPCMISGGLPCDVSLSNRQTHCAVRRRHRRLNRSSVAMGWAGKRHGDWTTLCYSCLKYAQYLRLYRLGRWSRGRLHNRPYNLHQGAHDREGKMGFILPIRAMPQSVYDLVVENTLAISAGRRPKRLPQICFSIRLLLMLL